MHAPRAVVGAALMTLTTVASIPAQAQPKVEVVLQLAGSASATRDQPYASFIGAVALSEDGQRALAGDSTGAVRLWNVADGSLLRTFRHATTVTVVAFAPDGRRIVTISKAVRVWDAETGRLIHLFEGALPEGAPLAMSRDGARIVSSGNDATANEFEVVTARSLRSYSPDTADAGPLAAAAYSADGRYLLTANQDAKVRLWNSETGELVRTFDGGEYAAGALTFSPDGSRVLAVSGSEIRIWDTATGKLIRRMEFSNSGSPSIVTQGSRLFLCDGHTLSVIDPAEGKVVRSLDVDSDRVTASAFARDGKHILVATDLGVMRLVDNETGKAVREFDTPFATTVLSVAFSADGKQLFAGENGTRIQQWDLGAARLTRAFEEKEPGWIRSLALSSDAGRLLSGEGSSFTLWDTASGRAVRTFATTDKQLMPATLSPDGRYVLANGPKDNEVSLYSAANGDRVRTLRGDFQNVLRGIFSPDGQRVATVGFSDPVRLWDVTSGNPIRVFKGTEQSTMPLAFSHDGKRFVVGGGNDTAALWDVDSGARVGTPFPYGESYMFSSDGRRLLTTSAEQTNLIDIASGKVLAGLPGQIPFEIPALFLPDSRSFLVGGYARLVTQRDVSTGGIIRELVGHSGPVIALAISPDGKRAVSSGPDTTLKLWSIDSGELLATFVTAAHGEWIVLTPEGFFSASAKGANYLKVVSGFDALPAERFRQLLHRPDLVAEKIAGDPRGTVREAAGKLDLAGAFAAAKQAK